MSGADVEAVAAFRAAVNPFQVDVLDYLGGLRTFTDAVGEFVTDAGGRRYLDLCAQHGAATLGHRHPRLVAALTDVIASGSPFTVPHGLSDRAGPLARRLVTLAGGDIARAYFCTGGSEAVDNAMKFAMASTGRPGFVSFGGGFHGLTCDPLTLVGNDWWRRPLPVWSPPGRSVVPFGDLEQVGKLLAQQDVAAVLVESVQGAGGAREWPAEQLRELARLCRAYGTLLVADEVLTGVGRTGDWFAYQHAGVVPDIVVVSKGLSGGIVPVAAVLMTRAVHESVYSSPARAFVHSSTFQGHLLGMVAGMTVLDVIEDEGILARVRTTGRMLLDGLAGLREEGIGLGGVRGRGLLVGVEIEGDPRPDAPDGAGACARALAERGVLVETAGHDPAWLRLNPPLTLSGESVALFLGALRDSLREIGARR